MVIFNIMVLRHVTPGVVWCMNSDVSGWPIQLYIRGLRGSIFLKNIDAFLQTTRCNAPEVAVIDIYYCNRILNANILYARKLYIYICL
jgi:hypothetical protein